jgi:malate dehydrogenase (oxaloacetate-decarboxylating)
MHGHIYRNARGIFVTPQNVDRMDAMVESLPSCDIEIIVVTDSEAILGIGDQGLGGMSIPIGKLSLYTVGAGIHPSVCLPICLDVGTNNQELLDDPLYLGTKEKRLTGKEYDDFILDFVEGVKRNFPSAVLQWEDFSKQNAYNNMDSYKKELPSFNDDIQGTGAVVLGGIIGAMKIKDEKLSDQRFAIFGAGAAGIGIARQIRAGLLEEGLSKQEAADRIFTIDSRGLITEGRSNLEEYKKDFARPKSAIENWEMKNDDSIALDEVIKNAGITVLTGTSAQTGAFDDAVINLMMDNTPMPVIFPLSNPTSKAEADPRNILEKTSGKAIVASGSPFPPIMIGARERRIGQGNNAFIFPGLGLGAIISRAKEVTDGMFTASAHALAETISDVALENKCVYPPIEELFDVSFHVAKAVYLKAVEEGVGAPLGTDDIDKAIKDKMWIPVYPKYIFK